MWMETELCYAKNTFKKLSPATDFFMQKFRSIVRILDIMGVYVKSSFTRKNIYASLCSYINAHAAIIRHKKSPCVPCFTTEFEQECAINTCAKNTNYYRHVLFWMYDSLLKAE